MTRILLVEDNELNRDMLSRRLQKRGFEISVAVDGVEGVEIAHSSLPDLILMDMSLPRKDGWQATAELKADPATAHIPIIFMTGLTETEHLVAALEAGGVTYWEDRIASYLEAA